MHDLIATLRRIAGTKPAKTPAGLLVTAGQLRHLADEIELLLGRVDHLGRSRDEALEAVESLQARVAELSHDISKKKSPKPCPICSMPMDDVDGECLRHDLDEIAEYLKITCIGSAL